MSAELAEDVGGELARLYAEWIAANEAAAAIVSRLAPGEAPKGARRIQFEQAEARAARVVYRYRALAGS